MERVDIGVDLKLAPVRRSEAEATGPGGAGIEIAGRCLDLFDDDAGVSRQDAIDAAADLEGEEVVLDDMREGDFLAITLAARALYFLVGTDGVA